MILHFVLCTLHLSKANAQGNSLRVSPSILQIKLHPPTQINAPITIENLSDEPVILQPSFRLFKASDKANGTLKYLPDRENKSSLFGFVQLRDKDQIVDTLILSPKEKKELHLVIRVNEDQVADTYFSVMFVPAVQAKPPAPDQSSSTSIRSGVAMNVLLSPLENNTKPQGAIEEFSTASLLEHGPVDFSIKLQNKSSNYINPKGTIHITNMFGQMIGKLNLPSPTILSQSTRYIGDDAQNQTHPVTTWNEGLLFGLYTAKLTVWLSPDGPILTKTIHFIGLPTRFLLGFIALILLVVTIYVRVKARMSE